MTTPTIRKNTASEIPLPKRQKQKLSSPDKTQAMEEEVKTTPPSNTDIYNLLQGQQQLLKQVASDVGDLKQSLSETRNKVITLEKKMDIMEGKNRTIEGELKGSYKAFTELERQIKILKEKNCKMENEMRRKNLRFMGIPEKSENGHHLRQFMEKMIKELFGVHTEERIILEKATRMGKINSNERSIPNKPRQVIVTFQNLATKEEILDLAKGKGEILWKNHQISIYPDYSKEINELRKPFIEPKRLAREMGLKTALYFPARLIIYFQTGEKTTENAEYAMDLLKKYRYDREGERRGPPRSGSDGQSL